MTDAELTVRWRLTGKSADRASWQPLIGEFEDVLFHPERVELVITDRYQAVAGEYSVRSPVRANTSMTAQDYQAVKADGAMAAAKTIDLPGGQVVVVASVGLPNLGPVEAKRILIHEAQHVRLYQEGNAAWGVHRRVDLERPADIGYDFIWHAESAIDEFRCERAVGEAGMPPAGTASVPADYPDIIRTFRQVQDAYWRTGNLLGTCQAAFGSLERLSQFLAYGAAHITVDPSVAEAWSSVPAMALFVDICSGVPAADALIEDDGLMEYCIKVARMLRHLMRENGFDSTPQDDGGPYFEILS